MLSLKYHRQYLWVFFVMFMALMCAALAMDCYYVATDGSSSGGTSTPAFLLRTPRFINVVCVFVFAAVSAVMQHYFSKAIVKTDMLLGSRKIWYKKNIKVRTARRKKTAKKVAKKHKPISFAFSFMLCNMVNLIPVIILYGLWVGKVSGVQDTMSFAQWNNRSTLCPEFFIPSVFVKYLAWYVNGFLSGCHLFRKNPRRNILLASPMNI